MYIQRKPLGEGGPRFGRRRRPPFPYMRVIFYLAILLGSLYVYLRMDRIQPQVLARIGPEPTPTLTAQTYATQALNAYNEGELDAAVEAYREAVAREPDNIDYQVALARMLILTENTDEGLVVAEQAILTDPESAKGYAIKAMALDWQGNPEQAVVEALRAIEIDPEYAPARAYLAEAYVDLGRWTQAREQAEMAIRLDPFDVDARRNYAYLLEFVGDYEGAIAQYQQALSLNPNLLFLLYGLARNNRGAGDPQAAIDTFTRIVERTPNDPLPWLEIGKTYFELREDDAAQENLEQAVQLVCEECPLHDGLEILDDNWREENRQLPGEVYMPAWVRLGQVYFTRRNYESALGVLEEAIAWGEANQEAADVTVPVEAYYVSASAYYYLDRCDEAMVRAANALELYESQRLEDPNALKNILSIYVLCRDYAATPPSVAVIFPAGYEEPTVTIELPGDEPESEAESGVKEEQP